MKERIQEIALAMGLTAESFEARKRYTSLTRNEEQLLASIQPLIKPYANEIINRFYNHLLTFEFVIHKLNQHSTLESLKETQKTYFDRLLSGCYDYDYALNRLLVGIVHQKIGVSSEIYTGAYAFYLECFNDILVENIKIKHNLTDLKINQVIVALNKLVLIDITLALEAYRFANESKLIDSLNQTRDLYQVQSKKIEHLAFYDSLTNLPNRNLLGVQVQQMLSLAKRESRTMALIYMDIINLKEINDTLGHQLGDLLLIEVSKRLKKIIRDMDVLGKPEEISGNTLARVTGDEFALACFVVDGHSSMVLVMRINEIFKTPITLDNHEVHVRLHFGVALSPDDGNSYEALLENADIALNKAKSDEEIVCFYNSVLGKKIRERAVISRRLEASIQDEKSFKIMFQPQIDLQTGNLCGAEVLVRWHDSELGYVSPAIFIPLAEERQLIEVITRKVLKMAAHQRKLWKDKKVFLNERIRIKLAINVSAKDLDDFGFADDLLDILEEENVTPQDFELELTETGLMKHPENAIKMLHHLRTLGFGLAIDDFGTGHSSLNYLREIEADILKIDMSFVRNLDTDSSNKAIVKTIIATSNIFGIKTLAEGIETNEIYNLLKRMGCHFGQGYFISKPLTIDEFESTWLNS